MVVTKVLIRTSLVQCEIRTCKKEHVQVTILGSKKIREKNNRRGRYGQERLAFHLSLVLLTCSHGYSGS